MEKPPAQKVLQNLESEEQGERQPLAPDSEKPRKDASWWSWRLLGPGLFVCLADTDAGCLVVAAQSGAKWGYSLLLLQIVLIPVLFLAQDLTVRLGVHSGKGHTACIRDRFGRFWAWFSCVFLVLGCVGAIISEMSGIATVASLWGLNWTLASLLAAAVVVGVVVACSYQQVEALGVVLGLFELTFVLTMFLLHPSPGEVFRGAFRFHSSREYLALVAANIGAVIMPWMIYFQQSAVVARRLKTTGDRREESCQTLLGSMLTQLVMIGALVTLAAASKGANGDLETARDIEEALAPSLGRIPARLLLSLAFVGGSLCAAFVVSLAAAWAICEAGQWEDPFALDRRLGEAPIFYGCFVAVVAVGLVVLLTGVNVIQLNIYVELLNALLLPMAVGFLYALATGPDLPDGLRVDGWLKVLVAILFSICTVVGLSCGIMGLFSMG